MNPSEATLKAAKSAEEMARVTMEAVGGLVMIAKAQQTPAIPKMITLTEGAPIARDDVGADSLSIVVINPNDVVVRLGLAGGSAAPSARGIPVPPQGGLSLPVAVGDLELGADKAELAAGDAIVYLLRFETVQPFFIWGRS